MGECEELYEANGFALSRDLMIEAYMVFGGVPFYLDLLDRRLSVMQNVDILCFSRQGELRGSSKSCTVRFLSTPTGICQ